MGNNIVERIAQRVVELLQKPKPEPKPAWPAPPQELTDLEILQREVAFQRKHGQWATIHRDVC